MRVESLVAGPLILLAGGGCGPWSGHAVGGVGGEAQRCKAKGALDMEERVVDKRSCLGLYNNAWIEDDLGRVKISGLFASASLHSSKDRIERYFACVDTWPWDMVTVSLDLVRYVGDSGRRCGLAGRGEELLAKASLHVSAGQVLHICVPSLCTEQELADFIVPFWLGAAFSDAAPTDLFDVLPALELGSHVNVSSYEVHADRLELQRLRQTAHAAAEAGLQWAVLQGKDVPGCSLLRVEASEELCRAEALANGFPGFAWSAVSQQCCFKPNGFFDVVDDPGVTLHLREPPADEQEKRLAEVSQRPLRLAICIRGEVRGFHHPEVHESIRDRLVLAAGASEAKIFYVLNLTSTSCHHCEGRSTREFSLEDLQPALDALPATSWILDPGGAGLRDPGCHYDQFSCAAIGAQLAECWRSVQRHEVEQGIEFDWLVATRPDLQFLHPLGDLRGFHPERIHTAFTSFSDYSDAFALVPRHLASHYFQQWLPALRQASSKACLAKQDCEELGCQTCSCGCILQASLLQENVDVGRLPYGLYRLVRT